MAFIGYYDFELDKDLVVIDFTEDLAVFKRRV